MAEACYREAYLPGSFKGVPFPAKKAESEHGRRGAEGEFPFGEETGYADLGRRIRRYNLTARFDRNTHVLEAAALIAACESRGPGILTHPTRGVIVNAACVRCRVRDDTEQMIGVTEVELTFVEAQEWPNGLSLGSQALGFVLSTILTAAKTHLTDRYQPSKVQYFREDAVIAEAQAMVTQVQTEYVTATVAKADDTTRNLVLVDFDQIMNIKAVARDTENMATALSQGMAAVGMELAPEPKFEAFRRLANYAARGNSLTSTAGDLQNGVYSFVRTSAAAYMAQAAMDSTDLRTGEVLRKLNAVETVLDGEAKYAHEACDFHYFQALRDFEVDTVAQLYTKAYNAPGIAEYDFGGRFHPLVAAFEVYGDAKRHRELEALNTVGRGGRFDRNVAALRDAT